MEQNNSDRVDITASELTALGIEIGTPRFCVLTSIIQRNIRIERNAERARCIRAAFDEASKIRSASPFHSGSGELAAVAIDNVASGCVMAAKALGELKP